VAAKKPVTVDAFLRELEHPLKDGREGEARRAAVDRETVDPADVTRRAEVPMEITTTPALEGRRITKYCGVVAGEAILGANVFRDLFAGIRDLVGGRSAGYERELQRARDIALQEMRERAQELGGNAIVGVDLDYEVLGQNNGMLMVSASGTAVVVE
jgi:uncharacterized protein YbjQ (UPF0145 family)